jgi:ABC1 atypical kinase-like domain
MEEGRVEGGRERKRPGGPEGGGRETPCSFGPTSSSCFGLKRSGEQDFATGQLERNTKRRATELRKLLGSLGPSFVKIGQALASRPDLLPQPYLESLAMLQDRLQSFPTPIALAVIEEELGCPIEEVFSELSPEPVAAASLGQVGDSSRETAWQDLVRDVDFP